MFLGLVLYVVPIFIFHVLEPNDVQFNILLFY